MRDFEEQYGVQTLESAGEGEGGLGLLPSMAYTGRLRPKGVPFYRL